MNRFNIIACDIKGFKTRIASSRVLSGYIIKRENHLVTNKMVRTNSTLKRTKLTKLSLSTSVEEVPSFNHDVKTRSEIAKMKALNSSSS